MEKLNEQVKKKIENKIEDVRHIFISPDAINLKNKDKGYVDIIGIAEELGFAVGNARLSREEDGFVFINEGERMPSNAPSDKLIGVNSELSLPWKRFVIAHELGHYFLHYLDNALDYEGMYAHRENRKGKNSQEQEADYFAACLLMPKDLFSERYRELKKPHLSNAENALLLSKEFIVTQMMAQRRIYELELSNEYGQRG